MKYCTVYLHDLATKEALHSRLKGALMLPDYYGCNLDALKDCLTDIREDTELSLRGFEELHRQLGGYALSLRDVLEDTGAENPHLTVRFL